MQKKNHGYSLRHFLFTAITVIFFLQGFGVVWPQPGTAGLEQEEVMDISDFTLDEILDVVIEESPVKTVDLLKKPSTVSIVDKIMIREFDFATLAEALQTVAGFSVTRTYLKRNLPTSRGILQDHYANKVLLLINGVPTWNAVTGEGNIDRIGIEDVEWIEVLKGPASVPYGANAYSGAVNIVLNKEPDAGPGLYLSAGSGNSYRGGANIHFTSRGVTAFLSAGFSDQTGREHYFTGEDGESGNIQEYLKNSRFTADVTAKRHRFFFNGFNSHESYLGAAPTFAAGAGNDHATQGYLFNYTYNVINRAKHQLKAGVIYDWNRRNFSRTRDDSVRSDTSGARLQGFISSRITLSQKLELVLGADAESRKSFRYENYHVQSGETLADNNLEDKSLHEYSVSAQVSHNGKAFHLLAGTRMTKNQRFGANLSSRATLAWTPNKISSIRFIWGQSFRAPSLFELYFQSPSLTVFGNQNLEPETGNSFELSYLTSFGKFFIQAQVYYAGYDHRIFRVKGDVEQDGSVYENVNVYTNGERFNAGGLELEIKYKESQKVSAFVNYGYIHGSNFTYIPRHTLSAGLARMSGKINLSAVFHFQSSAMGPVEKIGAQTHLDLSLGYTHQWKEFTLQHNISIKNAYDEELPVPEYVRRRTLNAVPLGFGRRITYTLRVHL